MFPPLNHWKGLKPVNKYVNSVKHANRVIYKLLDILVYTLVLLNPYAIYLYGFDWESLIPDPQQEIARHLQIYAC